MGLVPLPSGVSDPAALRGQDRAATDVSYIDAHVMPRLSRAWLLSAPGRTALRGDAYPPGAFADAEAAAQALDAALADGGNTALTDAGNEIASIDAGARTRAQGGEALQGKTLLQALAGTDAAAKVIHAGAIAAGVQEQLGDPLGAAAAIRKEIEAGNDDPRANAAGGLEKGKQIATVGLGVAALALVVVVAFYVTR